MNEITTKVFLLTGEYFDQNGKNILRFFGTSEDLGTTEIIINNFKPFFFIYRNITALELNNIYLRKQVNMRNFSGQPVDIIYFNTISDLRNAAEKLNQKGIITYESDVDPIKRFLMEKFINTQIKVSGIAKSNNGVTTFNNPKIESCTFIPNFVIASLDIETSTVNNKLYSIAVYITGRKGEEKKVFMLGSKVEPSPDYICFFPSEKVLLQSFFRWFNLIDPDIIIGWHLIGFDLLFIQSKCQQLNIKFAIGRAGNKATIKPNKTKGYFASVTGRIIIDGPTVLRTSFFTFEDFKLETVAQELLGEGKTISQNRNKVEEIERLFNENKIKLAEYNLKDAELVTKIFNRTNIIELLIRRSQLTGLFLDQLHMMSAAFDHFYLPLLHREGFVAPDLKDIKTKDHLSGGYVIEPIPGIYDNVIVLDFKSLYPSIIRTFKIDPLSRLLSDVDTITTPEGYKFSASKNILPNFIARLMQLRDTAKINQDKPLAQAIKILMNSFYGVMGSAGCRFYHPDLPSAITTTGKYLLLGSKDYLESIGYKIIYGDTDSLFVMIPPKTDLNFIEEGNKIVKLLNNYWRNELKEKFFVESHLEIEFEKYYQKFILTPMRSRQGGAKKRYAGYSIIDGKENLDLVGLEFVRSDWTKIAKEFQSELYLRIFKNQEIDQWIKSFIYKLKNGEFDQKLIYKKKLRKDANEYIKNIPQHVRAAKLIKEPVDNVYYVITQRGPIPIQFNHDDIDYHHYIEKQIKPIANSVLILLEKSFENILQQEQIRLF